MTENKHLNTTITEFEKQSNILKRKYKNRTPDKTLIPITLKHLIWTNYISEIYRKGICFCCRTEEISVATYECGHVVSRHNGGAVELDNLRPVCTKCNKSMATKNMYDFISEFQLWNKVMPNIQIKTNPLLDIIKNEDRCNCKNQFDMKNFKKIQKNIICLICNNKIILNLDKIGKVDGKNICYSNIFQQCKFNNCKYDHSLNFETVMKRNYDIAYVPNKIVQNTLCQSPSIKQTNINNQVIQNVCQLPSIKQPIQSKPVTKMQQDINKLFCM